MVKNVVEPVFTEEEILGIREGIDGVKRALPARCYHDEDFYQFEVDNILKKNWMCVGRWDQVENPGDYFTHNMFGESIIVVRDKKNELHALLNVCQHRWSAVVEDGSGNANLFMCPYHRWTYDLDGSLRGIAVQPMPEVDKKESSMPALKVEIWQGFIFVNFDQEAKPLAPQLEAINPYFEEYGASTYRTRGDVELVTTPWSFKFSVETAYEGYHHAGTHHDRVNHLEPATSTEPLAFGEICGSYSMQSVDDAPEDFVHPFGHAPGSTEARPRDRFFVIYPGLAVFLSSFQMSYILIEHQSVAENKSATRQAFAPWAIDSPNAEEVIKDLLVQTAAVQGEDNFACTMLQKGITSKSNVRSVIHPLEAQLNHYHNWYLDQCLKS